MSSNDRLSRSLNAAFVGVESHFVYTKSSLFFIDALRESLGALEVFASNWRWIHLPRKRHWDLLVFWQHFPQRWELDCLDVDSVVLVPMLDDCPKQEEFWKDYKDCKILCFSRSLADLLGGFGLRVILAQYYPPVPPNGVDWGSPGLRAFFWPRKKEVNWSHLRPLLEGTEWSSIHIHRTDNLSEVPLDLTEEEARRLPLATSSWLDSPQHYGDILRQHNVFFAPRRYEGIGLSFLEAMGLGMAVVSPDNPTMNEYIRTGENGYLYDPESPVPPRWADARNWGEAARRQCIIGREEWLRAVPSMIDFFLEPGPTRGQPLHDSRRTRSIMKAWPGYLRYRLIRLLIAARNLLRRQSRSHV